MRGKSGYTYRTYQDFGAKNASFYASDKSHYGNDVPFEVPEGWVKAKIGEVFTLQAGKNIHSQDIHSCQDMCFRFPCYGGNGIRGYVSHSNKIGTFPIIGRQGALCGNVNIAHGEFYATEHAVVVNSLYLPEKG